MHVHFPLLHGYPPLFRLGQCFDLFAEVGDNFLVLLLQNVSSFLRLQVHIFEQFAQFGQFGVALAVDFQLRAGEIFI